ncbi:MAG: polysaccharide biosynthesis/export family protein [Verrucomicrobiota bacterium]
MTDGTDDNQERLSRRDEAGPLREPGEAGRQHNRSAPVNREALAVRRDTDGFPAMSALPLMEALAQRWKLLGTCGVVLGTVGVALGMMLWQSHFTAVAQLVRYDSPNTVDVFGYRQISSGTFAGMLRAAELLEQIGQRIQPPMAADELADRVRIMPERSSEIVAVAVAAETPEDAVNLANLYVQEAIRFTQQMQARSAAEISQYAHQQLTDVEKEIRELNRAWRFVPQTITPSNTVAAPQFVPRASNLTGRLETERDKLFDLLTQYTDAHPNVQKQRAIIEALEQQVIDYNAKLIAGGALTNSPGPSGSAAPRAGGPSGVHTESDPEIIRGKLQALENHRLVLLGRQRAAQSFEANPPGYFQILAEATLRSVVPHGRAPKVALLGIFFGLIGVTAGAGLVLWREAVDDRLRTAVDVQRVTHLPVLARLNNLHRMDASARRDWAFRTWTALQRHMSASPNQGLVCGVTSSGECEGRSTWVNLLAQAASQRGFRVLTIATRPSSTNGAKSDGKTPASDPASQVAENGHAVATNVLATPAEVTQKLIGPDSQPLVHIPLPGWVWNLERRKQWQAALNHWRQIDNIVILVELPPASVPEALLLAENLPNVVWLADSGRSGALETREQLDTLRNARCRLVGAVLNHEPASRWKTLFPRWLNGVAFSLVLACSSTAAENRFAAASSFGPAFNGVSNLRVVDRSADGSEAVLLMEYNYDGFGGPMVRLVPHIENRAIKRSESWFHAEETYISRGRGMVSVRVKYLPEQPGSLTTDRVTVHMVNGNRLVGVGNFLKDITWGQGAMLAPAAPEPGIRKMETPRVAKAPPKSKAKPTAKPSAPAKARASAPQSPGKEKKVSPAKSSLSERAEKLADAVAKALAEPSPTTPSETPPPTPIVATPAATPTPAPAVTPPTPVEAVAVVPVAPEPVTPAAPAPVELAAAREVERDTQPKGSFSASAPARRAPWQQRLTLGPGDVLDLSIFGEPELTRTDVFIGPDGRISFLEAHDILAAGLTVDELRAKLDEELSKYRRAPRTVVVPSSFRSKKYYLLGHVTQRGVFTLERPTSIIEAVARARGLETGLADQTIVEMADLSRSFLVRHGERVMVDFEKLFLEGDLTQNIALEPDDYLYFPANNLKEVYVLGEVTNPGLFGFIPDTTVLAAISRRGGFTQKAWKGRVLVVRGSLNKPEAHVVDINDVLNARAPDLKLQPRDIVYVSSRPWVKAEELLDAATQAFAQAAVIVWTGGNVGPLIK